MLQRMDLRSLIKWARVFLWCGLIFYLSSIPNLKTEFGIWDLIFRKIAHMFVFGLLFLFLCSAISGSFDIATSKVYVFSVVFSIMYAVSDEYHQSFVPGRHGSAVDVLIDSVGIFTALLVKKKKSTGISYKDDENK